jgi:hypothetical protein
VADPKPEQASPESVPVSRTSVLVSSPDCVVDGDSVKLVRESMTKEPSPS